MIWCRSRGREGAKAKSFCVGLQLDNSQKNYKERAFRGDTTPTACCNGQRSKAALAPGSPLPIRLLAQKLSRISSLKNLDRRRVRRAAQHRKEYFLKLKAFLPNNLLCVPTIPTLAPLKGIIRAREHAAASDYYPRTLSLTFVAGLGRLPQVSLPLAESGGVPVGLSLLAANGRDAFLLGVVGRV